MGRKRQRDDRETYSFKRSKQTIQVPSLLDTSAKCVAESFPYQEVEEKLGFISGPIQDRIMFHSFPQNEACIALYSSNTLHVTDSQKQPFNVGVKLLEIQAVTEVVQIGFHLSGVVYEKIGICNKQKTHAFKCSMNFDRNCITSTSCTCNSKSHLWCPHIVALALYRIRNAHLVPIKPPISDSVIALKQEQLQKVLLMLVSSHRNDILPAIQILLDEIHEPDSEISLLTGIPDPTAGGGSQDDNTWHIDDISIKQQIQNDLADGNAGKNIISLMNKVREMISAKDRNYVNLLLTITEPIMNDQNKLNCQRTRRIHDELQSLWFSVLLNPNLHSTVKLKLNDNITKWFENPLCPKENPDDLNSKFLLQSIATSESNGDVFAQAARMEALKTCGYNNEALTVAKQILQTLKQSYTSINNLYLFEKSTEPIFNVYNALLENELENEAVELAILSLCHSYSLPDGEYAQKRLTHRYEQLVSSLESLDFTKPNLKEILLKYANKLYANILTMLEKSSELLTKDILPNHCFMRFLFLRVIEIDVQLAFRLSLIMLPLNLNKSDVDDEDIDIYSDNLTFNDKFCFIKSHLEYQQGELAASILKQCDSHPTYLKLTLTAILEDIKHPDQVLRLAKLCQSTAVVKNGTELLAASFELGVRSIRLIRDENERKSCIRWLVSCAVDTGRPAVEFLIRNWTDLFAAKEISSDVAPILTSQPVFFHLNLSTNDVKEEFLSKIRNVVIEACIKDPVPCVLFSLTLCEEHQDNFDLVCQIVSESSDRFNTAQLFSVARYLENKQHLDRAFKIGVQALKKLDIGALDCQHPAICDVLWISTLAGNLGMDELTQVVPVIEHCIHNPLLLTEIAERCSNFAFHHNKTASYSCHREPLNRLVASAQKLFVRDIELKLQSITRKNYNDFTAYLHKIRRAFLLSEDGNEHFQWLIDYIMTSQKGKKKLHEAISQILLTSSSS